MQYDFTSLMDRHGKDAIAVDGVGGPGAPGAPKAGFDVIPMWVADMNFPTCPTIQQAIIARAQHPAFGYFDPTPEYYDSIIRWQGTRNGVQGLAKEHIGYENGVLGGVISALNCVCSRGDKVLLHSPTYIGFTHCLENNGYQIIHSPLVKDEANVWRMDFADMERRLKEEHIHAAILCNPHNPSGRVFTKEELTAMGDICVKHGVTVVSDEIHNDFVFRGEHTVFASIKKEFEDICVVCTSPSKTFNLASMMISNIFVPNKELRQKFQHQVDAAGISQLGVLGLVATQTAYEKGDEWYESMLKYVWENIAYVKKYVKDNMPGVNVIDGEGTYLLWLDFRGTGIDADELDRRIIYDAKLWLDSGKIFGKTGTGFQRINVAAPRKTIEECMERIKKVL